MTYAAFVSYSASSPGSKEERKIVALLSEMIAAEIGAAVGEREICFMAPESILAGEEWADKVLDHANTARVLVILCTRRLFYSEWCAMEFEVFRRRWDICAKEKPVIFPILMRGHRLPPAISKYQTGFAGNLEGQYRERGLLGIPKKRRLEVLQALAAAISNSVRHDPADPLDPTPELGDLRGFFEFAGSMMLQAVILHDDGGSWKIDQFNDTAAVILGNAVDGTSRDLGFRIDKGPMSPSRLARSDLMIVLADGTQPERWADALSDLRGEDCLIVVDGEESRWPSTALHINGGARGVRQLETLMLAMIRDHLASVQPAQVHSDTAAGAAAVRGTSLDGPPLMYIGRTESSDG